MSGERDGFFQQFSAACEAAAAVAAEWADRVGEATADAFHKLASDPAIRSVWENWRVSPVGSRRECECVCATAHPDDIGVCDKKAVITRRLPTAFGGLADVPLCAPCAVAQGVAEQAR